MESDTFSIRKDDWRTFEKDNVTTSFNILYAKKEKIYPVYVSKDNSNPEKQVILLMFPNGENSIILR